MIIPFTKQIIIPFGLPYIFYPLGPYLILETVPVTPLQLYLNLFGECVFFWCYDCSFHCLFKGMCYVRKQNKQHLTGREGPQEVRLRSSDNNPPASVRGKEEAELTFVEHPLQTTHLTFFPAERAVPPRFAGEDTAETCPGHLFIKHQMWGLNMGLLHSKWGSAHENCASLISYLNGQCW